MFRNIQIWSKTSQVSYSTFLLCKSGIWIHNLITIIIYNVNYFKIKQESFQVLISMVPVVMKNLPLGTELSYRLRISHHYCRVALHSELFFLFVLILLVLKEKFRFKNKSLFCCAYKAVMCISSVDKYIFSV